MRRALILLGALAAFAAFATPATLHLTQEQCFLASLSDGGNPAAKVNRDSLSTGLELQNQGSTTIWCALTNQADAVVNHSRSVPAGSTWSLDVSANVAVWCLAQSVDQQTLQSDGGTADGGPAGCTVISNAH